MTGDNVNGDSDEGAVPQPSQRAAYVESLESLDASLDRVVMASDVDRQTPHSLRDIVDTFGSWEAALEAADIDVRAQIRDELARLHAELGHPPSPDEVNEHGYISATMVANYFDSFDAALDQAVDPAGGPARIESLVEDSRRALAGAVTLSRATVVSARATYGRLSTGITSQADSLRTTASERLSRVGGRLTGALRSANQVDHERRQFLKYATLSVTLAATTSSSDLLFGNDKLNIGLQQFGYGGTPLENNSGSSGSDGSDTDSGSSIGTSTPAPVTTDTPVSAGGTQTSDSETDTQTTPIPDASGTTDSPTDGADTDSTSTDASGTTDSPTDGADTDSTSAGSGETNDSPTDGADTDSTSPESGETTDSPTDGADTDSTSADSPTPIDRYDDLQDVTQNYGEEGYGGYATS
jgi:hypothetical protein